MRGRAVAWAEARLEQLSLLQRQLKMLLRTLVSQESVALSCGMASVEEMTVRCWWGARRHQGKRSRVRAFKGDTAQQQHTRCIGDIARSAGACSGNLARQLLKSSHMQGRAYPSDARE